jgi:flagellar biosynthesis/type III secretory pathway M-ring protein FliF/YscJ
MTIATKAAAAALPLFLAESTYQGVRSSAIGELLVQIAALAVIVMVVWNLVDRMRGGASQKREVSFSEEFATKEQHRKLEAAVEKIDHERRTSVAELHKKIEGIERRLNERIDAVPERTISLLRETKDLI